LAQRRGELGSGRAEHRTRSVVTIVDHREVPVAPNFVTASELTIDAIFLTDGLARETLNERAATDAPSAHGRRWCAMMRHREPMAP
jgi:hypothetical protein